MLNKVLCIDDDPITLMICSIMLEKTNFCTIMEEAISGLAGLRYFEKLLSNPDAIIPELILLDINMPVMNGWEFIEQFAEKYLPHFPNCKIIILTSSVNPEDKEHAEKNERVLDFMPKPLSIVGLENLKKSHYIKEYFKPVA